MDIKQLTGAVTPRVRAEVIGDAEQVEQALEVLGKKLPWHLHQNVALGMLALIAAIGLFVVYPLIALINAIWHFNWGEVFLLPMAIGCWYTSYRLARISDAGPDPGNDSPMVFSVISAVAAAVLSVGFLIVFFCGFSGPSAPAAPQLTNCKADGGVRELRHYNTQTEHMDPTFCNDGANLNDN